MPERVLRHVWSAVGSREGKTATCLGKGTMKPGPLNSRALRSH